MTWDKEKIIYITVQPILPVLIKGIFLNFQTNKKLLFKTDNIYKIYPEYYIIKVNQFDDVAKNTLDEWIYFLKKDEIKDEFKAKGLKDAKKQLNVMNLNESDRKEYENYIEYQRYERSMIVTNYKVGKLEGKIEGNNERNIEIAKRCLKKGMSITDIEELTGLAKEEIEKLTTD